MGILIKADGTQEKVAPLNGENFELSQLQGFVGGLIELVPLDEGQAVMVVNEEGLLVGLEPNPVASILAGQYIVGDVLLTPSEMIK